MQIVTAGWPYLDIDAYAGIITYTELLKLKGLSATAVSTAPLNESIPPIVRKWTVELEKIYKPSSGDYFTLIDLSDPAFFDKFVELEKVSEVIDHHVGFEEYWQQKIGKDARIEFIGAACTLIYESWNDSGLLDQISETSARLLVCGILDNTLNFEANVTTDRDRAAHKDLLQYANLPENWAELYFEDCEKAITNNIHQSLEKDTKTIKFKSFSESKVGFAQALVWDGELFAQRYAKEVKSYLGEHHENWFMNIIGLKDKRSRFLVSNDNVAQWLQNLLKLNAGHQVLIADRPWLRKEVIKREG